MHHNPASRSRSDSTRPGGSPAPYGARRLLGERVIYTAPDPAARRSERGIIAMWIDEALRWFR